MRAMDSVAPIKKLSVKANSKPWFDSEIKTAIQKRETTFNIQKVRLRNR